MALVMKLSCNGLQGYLGKGTKSWACLVEKDRAARLTTTTDQGQVFYGSDADGWLTVGTTPARNGYVGFYPWNGAGWPNWRYDAASKRLMSDLGNGPLSLMELYDGFVYCWAGDGYAAADVEIETVP